MPASLPVARNLLHKKFSNKLRGLPVYPWYKETNTVDRHLEVCVSDVEVAEAHLPKTFYGHDVLIVHAAAEVIDKEDDEEEE